MPFGYRETLFHCIGPGRVRRVEYPLEALFLEYPGRRFRGVHAQLVHIERHSPKRVLSTQLLDKSGELVFIDGFRKHHEEIEAVLLGYRYSTSNGRHIQHSTITFKWITLDTPGTVEIRLLCEHYLIDIHDIVVIRLYPGQILTALSEFFLYPVLISALPDLGDLYPLYPYPILSI